MAKQNNSLTWNLGLLYKNDDDLKMISDRELSEKENYKFIKKWKEREDYLKDPVVLKEALDEYEKLQKDYGNGGLEGYYFWLRTEQDEANPVLKAKYNKIQDFSKKIENDLNFFHLNLAKIPLDIQKEMLIFPGLQRYKHFLEKTFAQAKYLLKEEEEKIINLKSPSASSNWVKMTSGFLSKEEREVLFENGKVEKANFSKILSLIDNPNKKVRDLAASAFNEILNKWKEVAEAEINSVLGNKKVDDELRGTKRPDEIRHIDDDIETRVVDSLTKAVASQFQIAARYYKLKAKLFGVKKLEYHERNVPFGNIKIKYPYDKAVALVDEVLGDLDIEFREILRGFIKNGQVDIYPRKGKRGGAMCSYNLITHPTYILLNFDNQLDDVLTLAHELGHGINNELIKKKQHALNFGTPTSTAEVASTFFEDFVLEKIIKEADDELRLSIMMMKLNSDISSIFRQIALYNFEWQLHQQFKEKGYLSYKEIGEIFKKEMKRYMGSFVDQSKGSENWWVYIPHVRYFFYVYSYSGGLLISKALQKKVKKDPKFINNVKDFLSSGLSESPINIFKNLGIDISQSSFWEQGIKEIEKLLQETEKLAKKLGKI